MATVTPNFNWPVPTSTDLVKDGATAIEALGDSIDASLVDLKGGSTGQVLSKTTGTDMDFTWVTTDDANAIQNAIVDAKGDLIAASAADTPARLAVGANGETLVADSSTTTGLRYNPLVAQNFVINGSLDNWQRGTTFTSPANGSYTADRWSAVFCSSVSRSTDVPTGFQYSLEFSGTSTTPNVNYRMESSEATAINNQTVTISVWAQGVTGATALNAGIFVANAKDDFSGITLLTTLTLSANPSGTWTRYSGTFTATGVSNGLQIRLVRDSGTTTTRITGVQLELGSVMTTWKRAGGTIQGELAAAQRYYYRNANTTNGYGRLSAGIGLSTTLATLATTLPVTMRVQPTSIDFSTLRLNDSATATTVTALVINSDFSQANACGLTATVASGLTQYRPYFIEQNNSTTGYIGFSAEL
jgi:hypothetical protein